jgi:RimJ/RimL family protein N-acetyltransferase
MQKLGMTHDPRDDFDHPSIAIGHPLRRHVLYRLKRDDWMTKRIGEHTHHG